MSYKTYKHIKGYLIKLLSNMFTPICHFINQFIIFFQVPPIMGAIIEGIATCLCRLASRAIAEVGPKYAAALDSFIGTSLVLAGKSQEIL